MRDGIYKDLAIPKVWKGVLRCCERPAERGNTLDNAIEKAILRDARQEISPVFLRNFRQVAADVESCLPGFGRFRDFNSSRDLGGNNTPLENAILYNAKYLEDSGHTGHRLVDAAVVAALSERCESRRLQAQQHYLSRAGASAKPAMAALKAGLSDEVIHKVAKGFLTGERQSIRSIRRPVDVDLDDLSAPL